MTKSQDETGNRYGKLVVLKEIKSRKSRSNWLCQCDCGNTKEVLTSRLKSGAVRSCGCLAKKNRKEHGLSHSKEYLAWTSMKQRCLNPNDKAYANYGGRGITVCDEWKDNFQAFYSYIGKAPGSDYSIDRIEVDGNYEPGNVRWVKDENGIQSINQRIRKDNTSGAKGVSWYRQTSKWKAEITVNKKKKHLGYFKNKEDAVAARKTAELRYHSPLLKKAS